MSAVVDLMSHNRMEAANAVMDDDNGLTDDQKAMMIVLFAKDPKGSRVGRYVPRYQEKQEHHGILSS